ncbi:unnamed protein product, partial [Haemonchus placei]|uniref:REJ domain-containing protein n=1 Tax=Haemonchus placei TaxID=6290 RepID=A0A0N4WFI7_HAEPC
QSLFSPFSSFVSSFWSSPITSSITSISTFKRFLDSSNSPYDLSSSSDLLKLFSSSISISFSNLSAIPRQ